MVFLNACSHSQRDPEYTVTYLGDSNYFGVSKVERFQFTNGLKLLVLEDHSSPTFTYQTWFNVGSRDEQVGRTGLAHLFEHMMFKATKKLASGEFDKTLESAGAEGLNAFTSHDYTGYVQSLPAGNLELITSLEADRMVNLVVDSQALNFEREVVQNERRYRNENNPDGKLFEKLFETAFLKHSYHWPIIGYEKDLNAVTAHECLEFYKTHYSPNNATIVVVGDVSAKQVAQIVKKYYGKIKPSLLNKKIIEDEPKQTIERTLAEEIKTPIEKLLIGYRIPSVEHLDMPALFVLASILGQGKSSVLKHKLVDGSVATSVYVEPYESKDSSLLLFGVDMQKGRTARQALKLIDRELSLIQKGLITEEQVGRSIAQFRLELFSEQASHAAKARFIGKYETIAGDFRKGVDLVESINSIDKTKVVEVAKHYLRKTNRSLVFGVSKK